ncbi:hypothetical protein D915_006924 [Fasciola hepatica]|uniref:Uncharacterized protein n=1 Tax=Fasciola hepatica TaxID=6192 RepID=A0A4E0R6I9_FASHE|nr:hypothetical protein D915_006924 [Fasciola hepatica]
MHPVMLSIFAGCVLASTASACMRNQCFQCYNCPAVGKVGETVETVQSEKYCVTYLNKYHGLIVGVSRGTQKACVSTSRPVYNGMEYSCCDSAKNKCNNQSYSLAT